MLKKLAIGVGAVVALLVLVALVLPLFISANSFRPMLESKLSSALGRKVEIGNLSLSVLSGSVKVDSVAIADDPAFGTSPFLTASQLSAGVSIIPLIFSKRLEVTSFTITDPHVALLRAPSGRWNYSSLGAAGAASGSSAASSSSSANNFTVGELRLVNGTMTVGGVGGAPVRRYNGVNLEASGVSYTSGFPFHFSAATPGGGTIKLDGTAGAVNPADASLTPFQATLAIHNFDLGATGFVEPSSGVGGTMGFSGTLASDGEQMSSQGTVAAERLRLAANAQPATVPVNVNYAASYDLRRETGALSNGTIRIGKASATLGGTYDASGAVPTVNLRMKGTAMPVADLEGILPAIGIALPSGASLRSGGLDVALAITGPLDKLVIAGPVNLSNAKLAGFNLGGKLGALATFAGLGKNSSETEIQTLSAMLRVAPDGTQLQNLNLVVPAVGTMTGHGAVSSAGQLDCRLIAKLGGNSVAGAVGNALASITGGAANSGIPFRVTGTTAKPVFLPDFGGMAGGANGAPAGAKGAAGAASDILGRILKAKKPGGGRH
ncbi:MAG TPA: AsmA family protein [Terriglobales bacterium]|nr:AsmA family protein [Terriglobales bacterium]